MKMFYKKIGIDCLVFSLNNNKSNISFPIVKGMSSFNNEKSFLNFRIMYTFINYHYSCNFGFQFQESLKFDPRDGLDTLEIQ